jgi:hypothetical protein
MAGAHIACWMANHGGADPEALGAVLAGYDAHLAQKTFWTVSAWDSQEALDAFRRADPHRSRVSRIRPRMRPTTFTFWTVPGADLPISWTEARRRIAATEANGSGQGQARS